MYCPHCCKENDNNHIYCSNCGGRIDVENEAFQLPVGTVLNGRYYIGKVLGYGGFGITYTACHQVLGKRVAIKEFFPQGIASRISTYSPNVTLQTSSSRKTYEEWRTRFSEEARLLVSFADDPHIVGVTDIFDENDTTYMVMDYVDGETLEEFLKRNGPIPFQTAYQMLEPIMGSLERIHAKGMIHRDISPSNIMLTGNQGVVLLDFGAARSFEEGAETSRTVILKPGYAPIEQYTRRGKQGPQSDVYAFCATLYRAITGVIPANSLERSNKTEESLLAAPRDLGAIIGPEEEAVLLKGLEVFPQNRIKSFTELRRAFSKAGSVTVSNGIAEENGRAEAVPIPETDHKGGTRKGKPNKSGAGKVLAILLAAACACLFGVIIFLLLQGRNGSTSDNQTSAIADVSEPAQEPASPTEPTPAQEPTPEPEPTSEPAAATEPVSEPDNRRSADDVEMPAEEFFTYGGHTYAFYDVNLIDARSGGSRRLVDSYQNVADFCRQQDGHLAIIDTVEENQEIFYQVQKVYPSTVFFGLSDEISEGNWQWADGSPNTLDLWSFKMGKQQPDNGNGSRPENYAEFDYDRNNPSQSDNTGKWNDAEYLRNTSVFVCEWDYILKGLSE